MYHDNTYFTDIILSVTMVQKSAAGIFPASCPSSIYLALKEKIFSEAVPGINTIWKAERNSGFDLDWLDWIWSRPARLDLIWTGSSGFVRGVVWLKWHYIGWCGLGGLGTSGKQIVGKDLFKQIEQITY